MLNHKAYAFFRKKLSEKLPNHSLSGLPPEAKGGHSPVGATLVCFLLAAVLLCLALPGRPVDSLRLQRRQGDEPQYLLPLGQAFTTIYEHSVERTPVEDSYYVSGGRIYPWRTRTRSHNAGLPVAAPKHGRFLTEDSWLVLEGGHTPLDDIYLRVGDERLGRNELHIGQREPVRLFILFPGERVRLSPERQALSAFGEDI